MKLYHSTSSPNSRRVRIFAAEKGISIPLKSVNLGEKEQFSDWFKAINPRQQVPALFLTTAQRSRKSRQSGAFSKKFIQSIHC